jgi:hypothetical protein
MATYSSISHNFTPPSATTSAQIGAGAMTLIKTVTASDSTDISFVHGTSDVVFDNTYKTYLFKFINLHLSSDTYLSLTGRDGDSNFDATKTSTYFRVEHKEDDSSTALTYKTNLDVAQATGETKLSGNTSNADDNAYSGELYVFNPSSTTFVKHYFGQINVISGADGLEVGHFAGYFNHTAALDGIKINVGTGNIASGTIKMYGIA